MNRVSHYQNLQVSMFQNHHYECSDMTQKIFETQKNWFTTENCLNTFIMGSSMCVWLMFSAYTYHFIYKIIKLAVWNCLYVLKNKHSKYTFFTMKAGCEYIYLPSLRTVGTVSVQFEEVITVNALSFTAKILSDKKFPAWFPYY